MTPLTVTNSRLLPARRNGYRSALRDAEPKHVNPIIRAIGVAVPDESVSQHRAADIATELIASSERQQRAIATLYRRSGVETRRCTVLEPQRDAEHAEQSFFEPRRSASDGGPSTAERMVRYEQSAGRLAAAASARAVNESGLLPERITHLVTATCTGFSAPGFDLGLIDALSLSRGVQRTQVGFMGCHAGLNALRVAQAYCRADANARVLVCATELCSLHFQYSDDPQTIVSNALFADGAAAAVIAPDRSRAASGDGCDRPDWRLADHASLVLPDSADLMSWRIGDNGFAMTLSPRLPDLIAEELAPWVDGWLANHGLRRSDVGSWAIHPGGRRILAAAAASLELTADQMAPSEQVLREYGNMSSPTVLFILRELQQRRAQLPAVMLAFGPGITIEAALIT
ncbi:type III polyketide synthase [Lacipirellula limnantheis]|uniref:Alpha-pyrone synthesis polyketide synthase-like Pks18 n=1 Tax=Lacipirellula limnantheis TaxID=2528024 RepID=A0A517U1T9_9BACT|nr:type III polyketide synthase [Lacipirellula limnantheis]QDT74591.1 Alpha-pyrone synthesis polyketide synthase-like Pks18 [Lacipirellula limnantheis]